MDSESPEIVLRFRLGSMTLTEAENEIMRQAIRLKNGNRFHAGVALGIHPTKLRRRLGLKKLKADG